MTDDSSIWRTRLISLAIVTAIFLMPVLALLRLARLVSGLDRMIRVMR